MSSDTSQTSEEESTRQSQTGRAAFSIEGDRRNPQAIFQAPVSSRRPAFIQPGMSYPSHSSIGATRNQASSSSVFSSILTRQLAEMKEDLRSQIKTTIQKEMQVARQDIAMQTRAGLQDEVKKVEASLTQQIEATLGRHAEVMGQEATKEIGSIFKAGIEQLVKKVGALESSVAATNQKVDATVLKIEEQYNSIDDKLDTQMCVSEATLDLEDRLVAHLNKAGTGMANTDAASQAVDASNAPATHQASQQEVVRAMATQQEEGALVPTSGTASPSAPASFTLSATASSISFSMSTVGSPSANGTTPAAPLAQLRKTRQIIHDNNDGASASAMPPAKRLRTEEEAQRAQQAWQQQQRQ